MKRRLFSTLVAALAASFSLGAFSSISAQAQGTPTAEEILGLVRRFKLHLGFFDLIGFLNPTLIFTSRCWGRSYRLVPKRTLAFLGGFVQSDFRSRLGGLGLANRGFFFCDLRFLFILRGLSCRSLFSWLQIRFRSRTRRRGFRLFGRSCRLCFAF